MSSDPDGGEWAPVVLEPNAPGKIQTRLHHRHGLEAVCSACVIHALRSEIDRLATFLLAHYPGEPGRTGISESAVDVAIRLLTSRA